jgi:hypothetical protein
MKKPYICDFPCDCPNPNDCCHDDSCGSCDQPAVIWFDGHWLCQKHHDYHHACLYRGPRDKDHKTPAFPEVSCGGAGCLAADCVDCNRCGKCGKYGACDCWEDRRKREYEAEADSDDDRTFYVDGKPVPTSGTEA